MAFSGPRRFSLLLSTLSLSLAIATAFPLAGAAEPSPEGSAAQAVQPTQPAPATRVNPATSANPTNPLAGRRWGVYKGSADPAWDPYVRARGATKKALAKIALRPKAKFFGSWIPNRDIRAKVRDYVASARAGDPQALVQLTLFRMEPWGQEACRRLPTMAERASYKRYVDIFASAIGAAHAAVVLQPDGPFARCAPRGSKVPSHLIRYANRTLSAQPNTSVYIEMGSADWFRDRPRDAVQMLLDAGVAQARGFALDTSHFDSVSRQITFGARIVNRLAQRGAPGRHFVIDTSDNGRPFTGEWWHKHHGGEPLGTAKPCSSSTQRHCVALGIPPTTDVASTRWGMAWKLRKTAARLVDGYFWISRPWLQDQAGAFNVKRALAEIRYSPFH